MGRKENKKQGGSDGGYRSKASHGSEYDRGMKDNKHPKKHDHSDDAENSYIRL